MMNNFKKFLIVSLSLFFVLPSFAVSIYCPQTQQYVDIGAPVATVEQKCGTPTSKEKQILNQSEQVTVTQWFYWMYQNQNYAVQKPSMVIVFRDNKVMKIIVGQNEVPTTQNICDGTDAIKIGASEQDVVEACGGSNFQQDTQMEVKSPSQPIETWTYQSPDGTVLKLRIDREKGVLMGTVP